MFYHRDKKPKFDVNAPRFYLTINESTTETAWSTNESKNYAESILQACS